MGQRINNYKKSLDFLYSKLALYQRDGKIAIKKGLDNILSLCDELDNPQNNYPTIHIAGTNGKGSTAHILASILQASGLRVGMYTSPHYRDFRERIKINGHLIPKRTVTQFINQNISQIKEIWPTFFEISVAMAFDYFNQQKVDIAIIETGMGGRLDSTNIIQPICSIITNISYDHQASLGHTLPEIAAEKAGIIKKSIPVIIGEIHPETKPVFTKKAKKEKSKIIWAEKVINLKLSKHKISSQDYTYVLNGKMHKLSLQSGGNYQLANLRTVLAVIEQIAPHYPISISQIKKGLKNINQLTRYIGRWHVLQSDPMVIADAAHNKAGITELLKNIDILKIKNLHIVFGMVKEKDPDKILSMLPKNATYFFCAPDIPRALPIQDLTSAADDNKLLGKSYSSVGRALGAAKLKSKKSNGAVIVTGSSYVVAEVV